jgi:hypothetical protein
MALAGLLEKGSGCDLLCEISWLAAQRLMNLDVDGLGGRPRRTRREPRELAQRLTRAGLAHARRHNSAADSEAGAAADGAFAAPIARRGEPVRQRVAGELLGVSRKKEDNSGYGFSGIHGTGARWWRRSWIPPTCHRHGSQTSTPTDLRRSYGRSEGAWGKAAGTRIPQGRARRDQDRRAARQSRGARRGVPAPPGHHQVLKSHPGAARAGWADRRRYACGHVNLSRLMLLP